MTEVTLRSEDVLVRLLPEAGGSISAFQYRRRPVLRPSTPNAIGVCDPLGLACFPMVPYANRIRHGRFIFQGTAVHLTQPGVIHPLHGQGWRRPWRVAARAEGAATLEFEGGNDEWPWRYLSRQRFQVSSHCLEVSLELENRSSSAMPASLGLHPFFPDLATASLKAKSSGMWDTDDELIPTRWLDSREAPSFEEFTALAGTRLDNCFTRFRGKAVLRRDDKPAIRILSPTCRFMQVFTRSSDGSFCVEAQTAMPDAFNRRDEDAGMSVLQPGETLACLTQFLVED